MVSGSTLNFSVLSREVQKWVYSQKKKNFHFPLLTHMCTTSLHVKKKKSQREPPKVIKIRLWKWWGDATRLTPLNLLLLLLPLLQVLLGSILSPPRWSRRNNINPEKRKGNHSFKDIMAASKRPLSRVTAPSAGRRHRVHTFSKGQLLTYH